MNSEYIKAGPVGLMLRGNVDIQRAGNPFGVHIPAAILQKRQITEPCFDALSGLSGHIDVTEPSIPKKKGFD